jgi:hypothetical protein
MGIKSGGYNATLPEQKPFKYWVLQAAIFTIMRGVPYPDVVDVMDAMLEPISEGGVTVSGVRSTPRKPSKPTLKQLQSDLEELERTDPAVRAAAARYDQMVDDLTDKAKT